MEKMGGREEEEEEMRGLEGSSFNYPCEIIITKVSKIKCETPHSPSVYLLPLSPTSYNSLQLSEKRDKVKLVSKIVAKLQQRTRKKN